MTLANFITDYRYLSPFRNAGGSKSNGVEKLNQIYHFRLFPYEIRRGVGEMSE